MARVGSLVMLAVALGMGAVWVSGVEAQAPEGRRGGGMGQRDSILGLLGREEVQKELKLNEEQLSKVTELSEKLRAESREQFSSLRDIQDREQRQAKMAEMTNEMDRKVRDALRDVLEREQTMRLYQIRMQVRPVTDSLANEYVANRLQLTEDQKAKLAEMAKDVQAQLAEMRGGMRDADESQRADMRRKQRDIRSGADEKALAVLTDQQKEAFEKMKGEKFELQSRRGQ